MGDIAWFGRILFASGDLDPVYVALNGLNLERSQLARWLLSYWYFYHSGLASWLSEHEGKDYWEALMRAARNDGDAPVPGGRWPRGTERRHFRGAACVTCSRDLRRTYKSPEAILDFMLDGPMDVRSVIARACRLPMAGTWIGFKMADMIDAVTDYRVAQDDISAFLYDTPRQSIDEHIIGGHIVVPPKRDRYVYAMEWLAKKLAHCRIPHRLESPPDWFSLETVWCKYLSHLHGHYPLYKDIREISEGLHPWGHLSSTAKRFAEAMPKNPDADGVLI